MIEPKSHIGQAILTQREHLKLTQHQLAARMGKNQTYVARIEGGKRDPRWSTVLEFARALEFEPMLIPRDKISAVQTVLRMNEQDEVPPLAGGHW